MIVASSPRIGCNTQGIYVMEHGNVAIMGESNILNMRANGARNTSSMIHNIQDQEGCHLESVSLCILHNAEVEENTM